MSLPDSMTVPQIISRYFFKNLGVDRESAADSLALIKSGYTQWGKTRQGKEIAHIFRCLAVALESQARLYVCVDNSVYSGCAVMGEQFSVVFNGKSYEVEERLDMYSSFLKVNAHESSVARIIELLKECTLRDESHPIGDPEVKSMRQLYNLAQLVKMPERKPKSSNMEVDDGAADDPAVEILKELAQRFSDLNFSETYLKCNPENFMQAVLDIEKEVPPSEEKSMFVPSAQELFRGDISFQVLSQFGPTAPSVINRGGQSIPIATIVSETIKEGDTTTIREVPSIKYPFQMILVSQKSLETACGDMKEMFKLKQIMQNPKERAKSARNLAYEGATMDAIWARICRSVKGVQGVANAASGSSKAKSKDELEAAKAKEEKLKSRIMEDF
jgi:hypothetical protein